jgi:PAS domain S-box-containing protein
MARRTGRGLDQRVTTRREWLESTPHFERGPVAGGSQNGKAADPYRLVFDLNPQPMWISDIKTLEFLAVNEAAVRKYGYSRPEFLAMTADAIFSTRDGARFTERHRAHLAEGIEETDGVWKHCAKGGQIFEVEMWSRAIEFQRRQACLTVVQDVTARRQAENGLATRYALTRVLNESTTEVLNKALRCLCLSLDFDLAEIWLLDKAGTHLERQDGWYHPELRISVKGSLIPRIPVRHRKGTLPRVWAYGTPNWIPDASIEPGYRKRAGALKTAGLANGLAFAVRSHETVIGVVVLLQRGENPADPQILHLLTDVGAQIGNYLKRSRVEQELHEAERSFQTLFDDSPIACHEIDTNGIVVRVNRAQCEILGKDASEIIGTPLWDLMIPSQRELCRESVIKKLATHRTGQPFERKFLRRDGTESVFRVHDRFLFNAQGEVSGIRGVMLDLTESRSSRKQIEFQTRLLDQANDAILTLDKDFAIQYCNGAAERLFGWKASEAIGQPYKVVAGTVVSEAERKTIHEEIFSRGAWNGEIICTKPDGTQFVVHVSWSVLRDSSGNASGVVGIHRDITAPKQMEQALKATENRLRLAQTALSLGTWEVDLASGHVQCSEEMMCLYGRPGEPGAFDWRQWQDLVHPEDRDPRRLPAHRLFAGRDNFDQQFRVIWPDGSVHWLHSKALVARDEQQKPCRVIGVDFDITEHKRTEERLHVLSSAVDQSPVSVLIADMDGKIQYVNARLTEATGYTLEELRGKNPSILLAPDTPHEHFAQVSQAIQTGQWKGIMHSRRKNGELFWESASIRQIRDSSGNPTHALAVAEDITDRLEMEAALKLSEERFRIAAESSGDSIYEWDLRSDQVTMLGGSGKRSAGFGWNPPWQGNSFRQLLHPVDRERVETAIRRNLDTGEPYKQEYRMTTPSGEVRYYADQGSALRDKMGKPYKWIGVCRDITEEKKRERANAELAAVVECADAAIISHDFSGEILTWNRGAERIYGYSPEEMIGRTIAPLIPADRQQENHQILERLGRGESIQHLETTRLTKSGVLIHVLLTISPIRDSSGAVLGMAQVAWDITQIKDLERQLAQTQKLESIGHLAAGIAHEINTPIQYIGDNGKFLQDAFNDLLTSVGSNAGAALSAEPVEGKPLPSQQELDQGVLEFLRVEIPKAIEQLLEGVDQVARIVRAMKEFSHPGPVEKLPLDINRAIESTILVSKNEWKYVAEVTTELDHAIPPVPCVAGEFNQVILNLIVNAAHAISDVVRGTNEKGAIHISTKGNGSYAEIRISDTGCGIPEAIQSKVFDPFFTTKPVGQGTGQGLAIAHSVIVQKHRGTITLESKPGQGTTLTIKLPLEARTEEA